MALTLWRGDTRWGSLHIRERTPERLSAILLPDVAVSELASLQQRTLTTLPGDPVMQYAVPPIVLGEERTFKREDAVAHWTSLLRGETVEGIAPELQLRLEKDGASLPATMLSLVEAYPPAQVAGDSSAQVWLVFAVFSHAKSAAE
jgi:hypothetical protein